MHASIVDKGDSLFKQIQSKVSLDTAVKLWMLTFKNMIFRVGH